MNRKERRLQAKQDKKASADPGLVASETIAGSSGSTGKVDVRSSLLAYATGTEISAASQAAPASADATLANDLNRASRFLQNGKLYEAEQVSQSLLSRAPRNPDVCHLAGVIALQSGRIDQAIPHLQMATKLDSGYADAFVNLATALHQTGQLREAEAAYRKALNLQPDFSDAAYNLGCLLADSDRGEEAETLFRRAAALTPRDPEILSALASLLIKLGRETEAETTFGAALRLAPKDRVISTKFAELLIAQKSWGRARDVLAEAVSANPGDATLLGRLGTVLHEQGELNEAVDHFEKALVVDPSRAAIRVNLGLALNELSRLEDGLAQFQRAAESAPDMFSAHANYAMSLTEQARQAEAILSLLRASELEPHQAWVQFQVGSAYRNAGQLDDSIAAFRQGLSIEPNAAPEYWKMGYAYALHAQIEDAVEAYNNCLKLTPNDPVARYLLASATDQPVDCAPMDALADLFDDIAPGYQGAVDAEIENNVVAQFSKILRQIQKDKGGDNAAMIARVLDLGCGAGDLGKAIRPMVQHLSGIDICAAMEILTRRSNVYDESQQAEITAYLERRAENLPPYDVILSSGSFCFFGDLTQVLEGVRNQLTPNGHLIFTTENTSEADPVLRPTGSFAHSGEYIEKIAAKSGFDLVRVVPVPIRYHRTDAVSGRLCYLQPSS